MADITPAVFATDTQNFNMENGIYNNESNNPISKVWQNQSQKMLITLTGLKLLKLYLTGCRIICWV